jgi:hypothetical protein
MLSSQQTGTTFIIRHLPGSDPASFQVQRADGRVGEAVVIAAPGSYPVAGRPQSNLLKELRWYLEDFLDYPFPPETEHAEQVQAALRQWGEGAFTCRS